MEYILTVSCPDTIGVVAKVSGFLAANEGFIIESSQFGDPDTKRFFLRCVFFCPHEKSTIETKFSSIGKEFQMEWHLHDRHQKTKALILVSKQSHCLNDLCFRTKNGNLPLDIKAVVSNHQDLEELSNWYKIPFHHCPITSQTKQAQEQEISSMIKKHQIDLVILARYMQILSSEFVDKHQGHMINIHHSFLPSFKGAKPYHQAFAKGVKLIGATAHYVTADLDEGPIIDQDVISVDHTKDIKELTLQGADIETRVLARAIKYHTEHRIFMNGNKTVIFH